MRQLLHCPCADLAGHVLHCHCCGACPPLRQLLAAACRPPMEWRQCHALWMLRQVGWHLLGSRRRAAQAGTCHHRCWADGMRQVARLLPGNLMGLSAGCCCWRWEAEEAAVLWVLSCCLLGWHPQTWLQAGKQRACSLLRQAWFQGRLPAVWPPRLHWQAALPQLHPALPEREHGE